MPLLFLFSSFSFSFRERGKSKVGVAFSNGHDRTNCLLAQVQLTENMGTITVYFFDVEGNSYTEAQRRMSSIFHILLQL